MPDRFWKIAAALLLIIPSLASAQDRMARPGSRPQPPQRPGAGGPPARPGRPGRPETQPTRRGRPQIQSTRPGGPQIRPPRPGGGAGPGHGGPGSGNGKLPQPGHRPGFHRPPNYRPQPYRYPQGFRYRRWQIGAILPSVLFGSSYYFSEYQEFGLYPPPFGYRWVRYGPDLILVNTRNGHVRDVRYGVFD